MVPTLRPWGLWDTLLNANELYYLEEQLFIQILINKCDYFLNMDTSFTSSVSEDHVVSNQF